MSEQRFTAMETEWYRLATGAEPSTSGRASAVLGLGRTMAEQYQRGLSIGNHLAFLAAPASYQEAMREAANEQNYYVKCQALGLDASPAKEILEEVVAVADRGGLPLAFVWERAWELAIDRSMRRDVEGPLPSGSGPDPSDVPEVWSRLLRWGPGQFADVALPTQPHEQ